MEIAGSKLRRSTAKDSNCMRIQTGKVLLSFRRIRAETCRKSRIGEDERAIAWATDR
jgi:hypothetical protein